MYIREASDSDLNEVLLIERSAFGRDDEAELVSNLLADPSAKPILSLLAFKDDRPVGHILFTTARLTNSSSQTSIAILAPLAVIPDAQKQGIGGKLIARGLQLLSRSGVDLVFVLGYPEYYLRHGFKPALPLGLEAPYPIPQKNSDAWMVQALRPNAIGSVFGKVICANALNKPEYWRE
jgi:putative acetyltransferase